MASPPALTPEAVLNSGSTPQRARIRLAVRPSRWPSAPRAYTPERKRRPLPSFPGLAGRPLSERGNFQKAERVFVYLRDYECFLWIE